MSECPKRCDNEHCENGQVPAVGCDGGECCEADDCRECAQNECELTKDEHCYICAENNECAPAQMLQNSKPICSCCGDA